MQKTKTNNALCHGQVCVNKNKNDYYNNIANSKTTNIYYGQVGENKYNNITNTMTKNVRVGPVNDFRINHK